MKLELMNEGSENPVHGLLPGILLEEGFILVTLQPNGTSGHSCAGQQSRIPCHCLHKQQSRIPCHCLRKQESSFIECLEILDSRLRGNDTISALSGENQQPFQEKTISPLEEKTSGVLHSAEVILILHSDEDYLALGKREERIWCRHSQDPFLLLGLGRSGSLPCGRGLAKFVNGYCICGDIWRYP